MAQVHIVKAVSDYLSYYSTWTCAVYSTLEAAERHIELAQQLNEKYHKLKNKSKKTKEERHILKEIKNHHPFDPHFKHDEGIVDYSIESCNVRDDPDELRNHIIF